MAFKRLLADKTLRIKEPALKTIVNTAYFEDWAILLSPLQLAQAAGDACRYGDDPAWKPLK
ncbi:Uncharacterised protein [Achromobacter aegrifaciens]|uniref:Uncharacterized protein n=2 Tax=Achromobacter aegrifaciens TaxID=1287736 RepID=A0AAD2IZ52_ACHAE|nr:Uncharacterised protein [Achromobacter aegrifaciens]